MPHCALVHCTVKNAAKFTETCIKILKFLSIFPIMYFTNFIFSPSLPSLKCKAYRPVGACQQLSLSLVSWQQEINRHELKHQIQQSLVNLT